MMEVYWQKFLDLIGYNIPGFQRGFVFGIIAIIIILIILRILVILLNPKRHKCQGVNTKGEDGELFISSAAISDLINALENEFEGIKFKKTILYKRKSKYFIKILAELETKDLNFPDLISSTRERIFSSLSKNLGVNCISKIDILLKKVNSNY